MPVIRYGDEYALIVSDGKLNKDVYDSIVHDPHFMMALEVTISIITIAAGMAIIITAMVNASAPEGTNPFLLVLAFALSVIPIQVGASVLFGRVLEQYRYRSGRSGRNVEVLTHDDPYWKELTRHINYWPEIAREMERETLLGRVLEGIVLSNLYQVRLLRSMFKNSAVGTFTNAASSGNWIGTTELVHHARETAQRVADTYISSVCPNRQQT